MVGCCFVPRLVICSGMLLQIVCTTTASHVELVTASLAAGKHVFVEKPVALSTAETKTCTEMAKKMNRILYCGELLENCGSFPGSGYMSDAN